MRVAHVHVDDETEVVVRGQGGVEGADDRQPHVARAHGGPEQVELADEPGRGRDPDEGEQEDGEGERHHRMPEGEPAVVREPHRLAAVLLEQQDHAEGPARRERVHEQVEENAAMAERPARHHAHQHVAHVRDGGVGEHPLQVLLGDRDDVAHRHAEDGQDREQRRPVERRRPDGRCAVR